MGRFPLLFDEKEIIMGTEKRQCGPIEPTETKARKMSNTHIQDFTRGNITKQLIVFAWPLFLSNLLQVVYNMVDMVVVGHVLGKVGTSAVSVGGDVSAFLTFIAMGFSAAGQVLIAQRIGSRRYETIGRFVATMAGFLLAISLVISGAALLMQDVILRLMNTPEASYAEAANYAGICMVGLVFIYGYNIVSAVLRGMGDSKHPFVFIGIAAGLNVVLDILFVVVFDFGAGGAALATVISQAVSFISCTVFLLRHKDRFYLDVRVRDFFFLDRKMLAELVKLGTPMAIKSASVQISKLFVNSWINAYSVEISAFAGIANKISSIANLVSNAMNTAGSTMVGQNIAAREYGRVKQILLRLAAITLGIAGAISAVIVLFPEYVFGIFTEEPEVLAIYSGYIPIAVLLFVGSALRSVMNALLNGSGNVKINFATAIFDGLVMRIGLALLFGLALNMRHYGFWLGDALAGFTPFVIGIVFYVTGRWKKEIV